MFGGVCGHHRHPILFWYTPISHLILILYFFTKCYSPIFYKKEKSILFQKESRIQCTTSYEMFCFFTPKKNLNNRMFYRQCLVILANERNLPSHSTIFCDLFWKIAIFSKKSETFCPTHFVSRYVRGVYDVTLSSESAALS